MIHACVGSTLEVNRNASVLALIYLVKFSSSRFRFRRLESGRVTGFMHYAEEADMTFSHHGLLHISHWAWPSQGQEERLIDLSTRAVKLLSSFMSCGHLTLQSNIEGDIVWIKSGFTLTRSDAATITGGKLNQQIKRSGRRFFTAVTHGVRV